MMTIRFSARHASAMILAACSLVSATASAQQPPLGENEPNDSLGQARSVSSFSSQTFAGTINTASDVDYYKTYLDEGMCFTFTLQPNASANYDLTLLDRQGKVLQRSVNGTGQQDAVSYCSNALGRVLFYAKVTYVSGTKGSAGTYTLTSTH